MKCIKIVQSYDFDDLRELVEEELDDYDSLFMEMIDAYNKVEEFMEKILSLAPFEIMNKQTFLNYVHSLRLEHETELEIFEQYEADDVEY